MGIHLRNIHLLQVTLCVKKTEKSSPQVTDLISRGLLKQRNLILSSLINILNMEKCMGLGKTLLLFLFLSLLHIGDSLPATDADPTEAPTPAADEGCDAFRDDCNSCVTASAGCMFVIRKDTSETCVSASDEDPSSDGVPVTVARNSSDCDNGGEPDVTTLTPTPEPAPSNETTSATTTTTITPSTTTTDTTPMTTTPAQTTTPSTSTSTIPSTSTEAPTARPSPDPNSRGHFDGWSFFGGILLTLGMAAIGFVGFKYYKLRSSSGGNYNRF